MWVSFLSHFVGVICHLIFLAPLVKVKQAISRLQQELVGMDVKTGVIEQGLLQAQLRDRTHLQHDMMANPPSKDFVY